jgi:hypothetical protein
MPFAFHWRMLPTSNRPIAIAIAAAVVLVLGLVSIPPLLRPGIPVWRFRQLPRSVAHDLERRGCNIVRGKNVITGDFAGGGQPGWAVLCQQGGQASLIIYSRSDAGPDVFATHAAGLTGDPESARGLRLAGWDYVVRHNPGLRRAPESAGACIEDGVGMGSVIYCYLGGAWTALAGAD